MIYGAFYFEKKYLIRRKGIIKMHYLKEYFKKSLKKNFCLLMAAAMLSSGMELPANAAELTTAAACEEELHEETESETLVEDVLEEVPEETAETIDTEEAEIESEEDTTFAEEIVDTENQTNGLTIERPSEEIGIGDPIVGGKLPNGSGSWSLTNGKLIVSGSGEYWPSTGLIAPPWYEYREQIKTVCK